MTGATSRDTMPSVSVVLPTHNRPVWLRTALASVLEGEFEDFEVIVSNNGRPEHTRELAEQVDDPRVRWVEQPPIGMLEHLLAALSLARGRFVAALHDDDWWHPRLLTSLVPPLEAHPEAVVAFADQTHVRATGEIDADATEFFSRRSGRAELAAGLHQPFHTLVVRETIPIGGCVFRREALPPSDVPLEAGAAYDMWIPYLLARRGGAAYYRPDRLLYCRSHAGSVFATETIPTLLAAVECQRRMLGDPGLAAHHDELRRRLAGREQGVGAALLRRGSRSSARQHLATGIRLKPTARAAAAWAASWIIPKSLLARL